MKKGVPQGVPMDPKEEPKTGPATPTEETGAETTTISLPFDDIACIMVTHEGKDPSIVFALTDGRFQRTSFGNREKFGAALVKLVEDVDAQGFVKYKERLIFRPEHLRSLECRENGKFGPHILFAFTGGFRYPARYANKEALEKDYRHLLLFLSQDQDGRANSPFSDTKH